MISTGRACKAVSPVKELSLRGSVRSRTLPIMIPRDGPGVAVWVGDGTGVSVGVLVGVYVGVLVGVFVGVAVGV